MSRVLFIACSVTMNFPNGSTSYEALKLFKKYYIASHPEDEIIDLNLNQLHIAQKTLNSDNFSEFFKEGDEQIQQLRDVDKVVMASPMINFNIPAVAKNYFDHILVAKKTFIYKYDGKGEAEGLLPHLKVQIITSQGARLGWYPFGNHTEYLRGTWDFIGAKVAPAVVIHGTKIPENRERQAVDMAHDYEGQLKRAAEAF